jgi:hypothetical protein
MLAKPLVVALLKKPLLKAPLFLGALILVVTATSSVSAREIQAGAAKVDITNRQKLVHDPLHARALVIRQGDTLVVLVTLDVVSVGEIGHIDDEYLGNLRVRLQKELGIDPNNVIVNASHCHGTPCDDVEERTFAAVKQAFEGLQPVQVGYGRGHEDRIMENRRLLLASGREADVRHAYSLPADEEVAEVGPIDPEIGVVRFDTMAGHTVAVVYNFAMHPIQGAPNGGNTADVTGFSSQVIEENMSDGTVALFVQGCAGDINPISYKAVNHPRPAEPLGNMLGLSTLRAVRKVKMSTDLSLKIDREILSLPRADVSQRIIELEGERDRMVESLGGTSLNLKTFIPLAVKYNLNAEFPSYYSHRYLHEKALGRSDMEYLDAENRRNMAAYIRNIHTMEKISRMQTNLRLLRMHQADLVDSGKQTVDVELVGLRLGDFYLTTFPGELTVRIGLNIKKKSPHDFTFVAGYTNGYIYYAPTAEQLKNLGGAQEDSDCILAPEWQAMYETKALEILKRLSE